MAKTNFEAMRESLLARAGIHEPPKFSHSWEAMQTTEWSPRFEYLMRNRLLMGRLRYGPLLHKRQVGAKWDLVGAIEGKLHLYHATGNLECMVDIANYCLLEFECGRHPLRHFSALDDHHDHCKEKATKYKHGKARPNPKA